jgi:hypothetical protein
MTARIDALATDGPRERVSKAALKDCTISTLGTATRDGDRSVTMMLEFDDAAGRKLPVQLSVSSTIRLIAALMQSLGIAQAAPIPVAQNGQGE